MDHLIICYVCLVFVMLSCASVYWCIVVTCWESSDLLSLVCDVLLWSCQFPHWYPVSGVVLDCIDSWSLHSFWLWFHYFLLLICNKECFRYIQKTLTRTIGEEEFELLASVLNFRVFGGRFPRELFYFCLKRTIYVENSGRCPLFPCKLSPLRLLVLMSVKLNQSPTFVNPYSCDSNLRCKW